MWHTGSVAPRHVESSQTMDRTHFPCIGRQLLTHCATRGVSLIPIRSEFFHFDSRKYGHQIHRIDLVIRPRKTENSKACSGQRDNYRKKNSMSYSQRQEKSHSLPINTLQVSKLKMKIYTANRLPPSPLQKERAEFSECCISLLQLLY